MADVKKSNIKKELPEEKSSKLDKTVPNEKIVSEKKGEEKSVPKKNLEKDQKTSDKEKSHKIDPAKDDKTPKLEKKNTIEGGKVSDSKTSADDINAKGALAPDIEELANKIKEDFNQVAKFFSDSLTQRLKEMNATVEVQKKLQSAHHYFKFHENLCKSSLLTIKTCFSTVVDCFKTFDTSINMITSNNSGDKSLTDESKNFQTRYQKMESSIETIFKEKCKQEAAGVIKKFETVTMAGLGTESQQRLMSANAPKKTAPVEGNVGAVEETQIKRTFLPGLYNKVFSASQLNQQSQMHLSNKKKTIFKEYIERVEFNSTSDINLKGMGRLLVIRFSI